MDDTAVIPYYAHEGEMNRMERSNKRLWIVIIILIVALLGTNAGWLVYESQFVEETVEMTYSAEADENSNAVINGEGEVAIYGGESKGN